MSLASNSVRCSGSAVLVAALPVIREHLHDGAGLHLSAAALSEHSAQFVSEHRQLRDLRLDRLQVTRSV